MSENVFIATDAMIPGLPGSMPAGMQAPQQGFAGPEPQRGGGIPRFYLKPVQIDGTWTNIEMVQLLTPGDNKASPVHKVTDGLRHMYSREYEAWRKGLEIAPEGWPLEMWSVLSPAQVHALKSINIFTVEQLGQISDSNLRVIPMGKTLRNQAQAALSAKEKSDSVEAERRKNELLNNSLQMAEERMAAMQAQIDALVEKKAEGDAEDAPKRRGPGRPPKVQEPE